MWLWVHVKIPLHCNAVSYREKQSPVVSGEGFAFR
jgi:hypothetical protein